MFLQHFGFLLNARMTSLIGRLPLFYVYSITCTDALIGSLVYTLGFFAREVNGAI
jgi:hypothetical protein